MAWTVNFWERKKNSLNSLPKASKLLDATTFLWLKKGLSLRRLDGQLSTDTNYVTIMATDYHSSCPEIHFGHCSTEKKGKSFSKFGQLHDYWWYDVQLNVYKTYLYSLITKSISKIIWQPIVCWSIEIYLFLPVLSCS